MILQQQHFDFAGKPILQRVVFHAPLQSDRSMYQDACFLYNVHGDFSLYGGTQREEIIPGECVLMKCGQYFATHPATADGKPAELIAVHFYPDVLKRVFAEGLPRLSATAPPPARPISRLSVDILMRKYVESLLFLFEHPSLVTDELVLLKVKEVILLLLNTDTVEAARIKGILGDLFRTDEIDLRELINAHAYDNLTVKQFALLANQSISTFKRHFDNTFGVPPATYFRRLKLERAAQLLLDTDEAVSAVCYEVGFTDPSNFTKTFRDQYGCTPKEYRKQKSG